MENQRILLVDDQVINLRITSMMLKVTGADILTAQSGKEAIDILDRDPNFDLILTDVQMPEINGFETVEIIKQNPVLADIPVIFITAYHSDEEFIKKGFGLGAYDYLTKPFSQDILINKVRIFLSLQYQKKMLTRQAAELQVSNRSLKVMSESTKAILMADSATEIYDAFCTILIETMKYPLVWIGMLTEENRLNPVWGNSNEGFLNINNEYISSALSRLFENETVDFSVVKVLNPLEVIAVDELGIKGEPPHFVLSVPVVLGTNHICNIFVFNHFEEVFNEEEIQLLQNVGKNLSLGLSLLNEKKQRISLQAALENERNELELTLGSISDGVISANKSGQIIFVNNAAAEILDSSIIELFSKNLFEIFEVYNDDDTTLFNPFDYLQTIPEDKTYENQSTIKTLLGNKKIIILQISGIYKDNTLTGVVLVIRDMTEQIRTANQLSLAQKMQSVGQLAAGIAHEINSPMQFIGDNTFFLNDAFSDIKAYIGQIEEHMKSNGNEKTLTEVKEKFDIKYLMDEIPSALNRSTEGIKRVSNIVKAMKDFAHPSHKQKTNANLNDAILTTITITKNEWKYDADLETEFDQNLPPVLCSIDEINQVILNMIINAVHAVQDANKLRNKEKGLIKICTKNADNYILIEISDTGSGISKENLNRVFDPFFTTKEVGKGTGQGLAIAHDIIVNKHQGNIEIESKLGAGTKFIISLPKTYN